MAVDIDLVHFKQTRKAKNMTDKTTEQMIQDSELVECPRCKSTNLSRKYAAFYAEVNEYGDPLAPTELTDQTLCRNCHHEFEGNW